MTKKMRPRITKEEFKYIEEKRKYQLERRVLVIGDTHIPFELDGYIDWLKVIADKYQVTDIVHIGDLIDNHASSYHESDTDGMSAGDELAAIKEPILKLANYFPKMKVCKGNHDCYDDETEILTTDGWIKGVDLTDSHIVGTMNLDTANFEFQKPIRVVKYPFFGEMFKIKTENYIDLVVTPNHRIINGAKDNECTSRKYDIHRAYQVATFGYRRFPVSCENPNTEPVNLLDDEIKLLAWILSDGSITKDRLHISQSKIENVEQIKSILYKLDINYKVVCRERDITEICGVQLKEKSLPNYEFHFNYTPISSIIKDRYLIPDCVWKMNPEQFDIFLETYIDGDGSRKYLDDIAKDGCMIYGNKQMIDQLQALCFINGNSATISEYRPNQFRLNIVKNKKNVGFKIASSSSIVNYDGFVWCAEVDNSTLVIRRNGKIQVQGNSIPDRKAVTGGLSRRWIKSIKDILLEDGLPVEGWEFGEDFVIDNVMYTHGIGRKARSRGQKDIISIVQGHYHSEGYIEHYVGIKTHIFTAQVGCGIDRKSYAMAYGKHFDKPHISCLVVLENGRLPILEYMPL